MAKELQTDVLVIGGGVTGVAMARELTKYQNVDVTLVEKEADVCMGVSKHSSGALYIHTVEAFSQVLKSVMTPGAPLWDPESPRLKLQDKGQRLSDGLLHMLDVPHVHLNQLFLARNEAELEMLKKVEEVARQMGASPQMIDRQTVAELEPNVASDTVIKALYGTTGNIAVMPQELVIAYYENAKDNGAKFVFNAEVLGISRKDGYHIVETRRGPIRAEYVVNAAGLYADKVADMADAREDWALQFINSTRLVVDKRHAGLFKAIVFALPAPGVLDAIQPELDGTHFVGCASYDPTDDREATYTSRGTLEEAVRRLHNMVPAISERDVIASYVGVTAFNTRNPSEHIIEASRNDQKFINAVIRMPGLATAVTVAMKVTDLLAEAGLELKKRPDFNPFRKGIPRFRELSDDEKNSLILNDPRYGHVVCRCETVTEGEIVEAIRRGATTVQGVQFRTRAGMGRCQRGFCGPRVVQILARELGILPTEVTFKGGDSRILSYKSKELVVGG